MKEVNLGLRWIPISEQEPRKYETVAVCDQDDRGCGFFGDHGWKWDFSPRKPTHWMSLPDIPESNTPEQ